MYYMVWQVITRAELVMGVQRQNELSIGRQERKKNTCGMSAKAGLLPWQVWSCIGSVDWDALHWVGKTQPELIVGDLLSNGGTIHRQGCRGNI